MKLYYMPESPPCACVLMVIRLFNLDVQLVHVDLSKGEQFDSEFIKLNPLHTVPVLILDDGAVLLESRSIICFLADQFNQKNGQDLYPRDILQRTMINQMLYFDATRLYSSQSLFLSPLLKRMPTNSTYEILFRENLKYLENKLEVKPFVVGDSLTLADIAIIASLMFPRAAKFDFSEWPNLIKWMQNMATLQPYKEVIQEPLLRFTCHLDSLKN